MKYNSDEIFDIISDRIREAVEIRGINIAKLADMLEIEPFSLYRNLKKGKGIALPRLTEIANTLKFPIGFFFGENTENEENQTESDGKVDYIKIPLYESKAAATPGVLDVAKDEQKGELVIGCAELEHKGTLHAFEVRGKSMFPLLDDGDTVVIQTNGILTASDINRYDIYLCEIDDGFGTHGLTLKRVKVDKKGLILTSINPDFEALYIEMQKGKMLKDIIKGRVIRVVRDLK